MAYCIRRVRVKRTFAVLISLVLALFLYITIDQPDVTENFTRTRVLNDKRKSISKESNIRFVTIHSRAHSTFGAGLTDMIINENNVGLITSTFNHSQPKLRFTPEYPQNGTPRKNLHPEPNTLNKSSEKLGSSNQHVAKVQQFNTLSIAYENKWVGFPDLDGRYCQQALYSNVSNDLFRKRVHRTKRYQYIGSSAECKKFRHHYGFNRYPKASEEETKFPLAFIILFHNNFDQIIFLLRAIYHSHNVYCLSIDAKNSDDVISYVREVLQCLPNVFLSSQLEKIVYKGFSRLMADIHCMRDLLEHPVQWKYVINMPGQQFPLRTNLELVRILTKLNGTNDIEGLTGNTSIPQRYLFKYITKRNRETGIIHVVDTRERNLPPPHNLTIVKGTTYGSFSKEFVHFALNHPIAKNFLEYCKNVCSPDEYFWSTLQHTSVVRVPGGYTGDLKLKRYLTSYSIWAENSDGAKCSTRFVHKICIFTPEDLPNLAQQDCLFANKFHIYFHPGALHCMDEWLFNRTVSGIVGNMAHYENMSYYSHLNS